MLYIDIGNSTIKVASYIDGSWQVDLRLPHDQLYSVIEWCSDRVAHDELFLAASVVSSIRISMEQALGSAIRFIDVGSFPKEHINYKTPETLGIDRVLACYGAWSLSGTSVIVVDAGTATTIDYMNPDGVFEGGVIAPGLGSLEKALRIHAPALPVVERNVPASWPPKSTTEAVQWGITGSYKASVFSHIMRFLNLDPHAVLWISGGDADVLSQLEGLQTRFHPNLVLEGLRYCV